MTLREANPQLKTSAAMAGKVTDLQALAAIILWNSGHFDTFDIHEALNVSEDAVYRTLHAARYIQKGGAAHG